jgi:phosphate transport system permease protein
VNSKKSKIFEKVVEGVLFSSSTLTSFAVFFIIFFLFKEGVGLFQNKPIEKGYFLAVSKMNQVNKLSGEQIDLIFNQDITNWNKVGGKNDSIILFTINNITSYYPEDSIGANFEYLPNRINDFILKNPGSISYFPEQFKPASFAGKMVPVDNISIIEFIKNKNWYPTNQPAAILGILPLILGTLWVSLGAILFALPLGLATAIYMAEVTHERIRNMLKPIIELLAGIPSVVYGFFGLIVIVPAIQRLFNLDVGETALSGSIVLGIMALPTIITIAEDSIRSVPNSMREASLALGASKWQTIVRVVLPYARSGILAAFILGIGRAVGETMAVLMVSGNAAIIPHTFLQPVRTIPATIAAELGEATGGGIHYKALFVLGIILFFITLAINLTVEFIRTGGKRTKN